jgi:gas vesicle protein
MSNNSSDIGAFLAGFIIGGLVGAATALILAPQSGEETRTRLMARGNEWRDAGTQRFTPVKEQADSMLNSMGNAGNKAQEQTRIVLSEGKTRLTEVKTQFTDRLQKKQDKEEPPAAS